MKFQLVKIRGDERACLCPWHVDKSPSLFINLKKDKAICFAGCYSGTATGAIQKLLGYTPQSPEQAFSMVGAPNPFVGFVLSLPPFGTDYLVQRGITQDTQDVWGVYYDENTRSVVIPSVRRDGKVVGTIRRRVEAEAEPKYLYSTGFHKSKYLFGTAFYAPFPSDQVYVVEGPIDCMWMWQCGYKSTVALLGCSMSLNQRMLLKKLSAQAILCLDNDEAGKRATKKIASKLIDEGFGVEVAQMLEGKKDVQEHTPSELDDVIETHLPYLKWLIKIEKKR